MTGKINLFWIHVIIKLPYRYYITLSLHLFSEQCTLSALHAPIPPAVPLCYLIISLISGLTASFLFPVPCPCPLLWCVNILCVFLWPYSAYAYLCYYLCLIYYYWYNLGMDSKNLVVWFPLISWVWCCNLCSEHYCDNWKYLSFPVCGGKKKDRNINSMS